MWGTDYGLSLMGRDMLCKSLIQFYADEQGCGPPCCITWDQTMVEVMKIMTTSFKRSLVCTVALSAPDPAACHHWHTPLPETPGHSQASLGPSLIESLLLPPGSWCAQNFVCALQKFVSLVLCKFCNQIPLTSKFLWGFHSLCQIPRLGNLCGS